jgi:hypothetical protein
MSISRNELLFRVQSSPGPYPLPRRRVSQQPREFPPAGSGSDPIGRLPHARASIGFGDALVRPRRILLKADVEKLRSDDTVLVAELVVLPGAHPDRSRLTYTTGTCCPSAKRYGSRSSRPIRSSRHSRTPRATTWIRSWKSSRRHRCTRASDLMSGWPPLHVPAEVPVREFWSATVYSLTTSSFFLDVISFRGSCGERHVLPCFHFIFSRSPGTQVLSKNACFGP